MTAGAGYIVCPNRWARGVVHLATDAGGGLVVALCGYGGPVDTSGARVTWADSTALQPVYVADQPAGGRLCQACERKADTGK